MATYTEFDLCVTNLEPLNAPLEAILPFFDCDLARFLTERGERLARLGLPRWLEDISKLASNDDLTPFFNRMTIENYRTADGGVKAKLKLCGSGVKHYNEELPKILLKTCKYGQPDSYFGWWKSEGSDVIHFAFCVKGKFLALTQRECANLAIAALSAAP